MSRPVTPYGSVPNPTDGHLGKGYGNAGTGISDFAQGNPNNTSPLAQTTGAAAPLDSSVTGSAEGNYGNHGLDRATSSASTAVPAAAPSRSNTLKKKSSVKRMGSLKRSGSKRSVAAGSIKGVSGRAGEEDFNSVYYTPVPTNTSPTEVLANRFQAWRQLLKSIIAYFREIQSSYDMKAKALNKVQGAVTSISHPALVSHGGLNEATRILDDYHKRSMAEANKSREIENDVIGALTGLRSDLGQKIKEIKSLSGDFKNSVDKEKEGTRREIEKLQEALQHADHEDGAATGKNDPFVVRLGVDRMVERQIDEENYLHRAYLNLESSGRELESIVVGEIQKAYNALAGILKREADDAYHAVEGLRTGPISMPKDHEWSQFVVNDPHFVDPDLPLRRVEEIEYPGKHHPAATEIRAGMLERKSKYLKSYTPGWYVLSPTHLHEFKSADKIYSQPPVMSLYLPDQRLGSKSEESSSSHKFMLKGKQSGGMHKGHNWVFRAETHDTMLAWFEDIRLLTEGTGEQRQAFVRKHARSVSGHSDRDGTASSDGFEDDEADAAPYSGDAASLASPSQEEARPARPVPGGRFPSDLQVPRTGTYAPSSGSSEPDREVVAAAGAVPGSMQQQYDRQGVDPYRMEGVSAGPHTNPDSEPAVHDPKPATEQPAVSQPAAVEMTPAVFPAAAEQQRQVAAEQTMPVRQTQPQTRQPFLGDEPSARHTSVYGDWMAPTGAAVVGAGAGAAGADYWRRQKEQAAARQNEEAAASSIPEAGVAPMGTSDAAHPEPVAEAVAGENSTNGGVVPPREQALPPPVTQPVAEEKPTSGELGGLEAEGAKETGKFPTVVRHPTDLSVSQLHIPGEYPKKV